MRPCTGKKRRGKRDEGRRKKGGGKCSRTRIFDPPSLSARQFQKPLNTNLSVSKLERGRGERGGREDGNGGKGRGRGEKKGNNVALP